MPPSSGYKLIHRSTFRSFLRAQLMTTPCVLVLRTGERYALAGLRVEKDMLIVDRKSSGLRRIRHIY